MASEDANDTGFNFDDTNRSSNRRGTQGDSPKKTVPDSGRGRKHGERKMGIMGLPNSGKTSWLHALVNGAVSHATHHRHWHLGAVESRFATMTGGQGGVAQAATDADTFKVARLCKVYRPWFASLPASVPLRSSYWLTIPEVAGETVRKIAVPRADEAESPAATEYIEFLGSCDSVMCFVGIDGENSDAESELRPEESITSSILAFERVLGEAIKRRSRAERSYPLVATILVTKIDLLKDKPSIDMIEVNRDQSSVAEYLQQNADARLEQMLLQWGSDADVMRMSVTGLLTSAVSRGNLDLQERIAADFLRCHAPTAAMHLARLCALEDLDVRFFLSAPYGQRFVDARGANVFPSPDEIKPAMVYEPLEEAMERSWQHRAARNMRRRFGMLAMLLGVLLLLGPGLLWFLESNFESGIESQVPWKESNANLAKVESHPYFTIEQPLSPGKRKEHAGRLLDIRQGMLSGEVGMDDPRIVAMERRAYALDPEAVVAVPGFGLRPLQENIMAHDRRWVNGYLIGEVEFDDDQPLDIRLSGEMVVALCRDIDRLLAESRSVEAWGLLEARATQLIEAMGNQNRGEFRLQVSDGGPLLKRTLERARGFALVEKSFLDDSNVLSAEQFEVAVDSWARTGQAGRVRAQDELVLKADIERIESILDSYRVPGTDVSRPLFEFLFEDPKPWIRYRRTIALRNGFDSWYPAAISTLGRVDSDADLAQLTDLSLSLGRIDALIDSIALKRLGATNGVADENARVTAAFIARNTTLEEIADSGQIKESVDFEIRTLFGTPAESEFEYAGRVRDSRVSFLSAFELQRARLNDFLERAYADSLVAGDDAQADRIEALRKDIFGKVDVCMATYRRAIVHIRSEDPVEASFMEAIRSLMVDDCFNRFRIDIENGLGQGRGIDLKLRWMLEIIGAEMGNEDRGRHQDWLVGYVAGGGAELWSQLTPPTIRSAIRFLGSLGRDEFGRDRGRTEEIAMGMLDAFLADAINKDVNTRGSERSRSRMAAVMGALSDLGVQISCLDAFAVVMESIASDWRSSSSGEDLNRSGLELLAKMIDEGIVDCVELKDHERNIAEHAEKIDKWGLRRVTANNVSFWISEFEWDRNRVMRTIATSEESSDNWEDIRRHSREFLKLDPGKNCANLGLWSNFDGGGKYQGDASPTVNESPSSLRLWNRDEAANLVNSVGLRLPTQQEMAFAGRGVRMKLDLRDIPNRNNPAIHTRDYVEKTIGDVSDFGVIGLNSNVYEWVADSIIPFGRSTIRYEVELERADMSSCSLRKYHIGVRPVLDDPSFPDTPRRVGG
ncbi:hypothetical protein OAG01_00615 [bacterium]|nr:hypothetical protein [bacterium]